MAEYIAIANVSSGMKLAKPVLNKYKQTLLNEGFILEDKSIKLLKIWGISAVSIDTGNQEEDLAINEDMKQEAEAYFNMVMKWIPSNSYEKNIYEVAFQHFLKTKQKLL